MKEKQKPPRQHSLDRFRQWSMKVIEESKDQKGDHENEEKEIEETADLLWSGFSRLGYRILQVQSDDLDRNVRIKLANDEGHIVKLFLDDLCFDGETMSYTEWQGAPHSETIKKNRHGA